MMTYKLFTDGGARGNPGPAGLGAILFEEEELVSFENKFMPNATNNQAEYLALLLGLKMAVKKDVKELECFLDSELVVKQMKGEYKIKDEIMKKLKEKIDLEVEKFSKITFKHVVREKNKFADKLVNLALDNVLKQK